MHWTFDFGVLKICEFVEKARLFTDFPTGSLTVMRTNPQAGADVLLGYVHYKLDMKPLHTRGPVDVQGSKDAMREYMEVYCARRFKDELKDNWTIKILGFSSFYRHFEYSINPAKALGVNGSVQLLHGASVNSGGHTHIELYLPRNVRFDMRRQHPGLHPARYTGSVRFANRDYFFGLRRNLESSLPEDFFLAARMSQEDAETEIRTYLYQWFPFIKEYDMLGALRFDKNQEKSSTQELAVTVLP